MPHSQNMDKSLTSPVVIFSQFKYPANTELWETPFRSSMAVSHSQFLELLWIDDEFESLHPLYKLGFPGGSDSEEYACSAGVLGSLPGLRRFPGEGNGNPCLYSCHGQRNLAGYSPMDCKELDTTKKLTLLLSSSL